MKDIHEFDGSFYLRVMGRMVQTGEPVTVEGTVRKAEINETEEVATIDVITGDGEIKIGGLVAAFEDVEAQEIFLGRERIPSADDFE